MKKVIKNILLLLIVSIFLGGCTSKEEKDTNISIKNYNKSVIMNTYQEVSIEVQPLSYKSILVQKGIPVKFNLKVKEEILNSCNNEILISTFNIKKKLQVGDNIVEFTPNETGTFPYFCYMKMIKSYIFVVDNINDYPDEVPNDFNDTSSLK